MRSIQQLLKAASRPPQDLTAVYPLPIGVCCARVRQAGGVITLLGADMLPPAQLDFDDPAKTKSLSIPKPLQARYAAICLPASGAVIKLLNLPGQLNEDSEDQVRESMGIGDEEYRIGYRNLTQPRHGRAETRLLTVGIPEFMALAACRLLPSGIPAPFSIEIGGLAAMTAFCLGPAAQSGEDAIGCILTEEQDTFVAFFLKGELLLIRKFDFGNREILTRIRQSLGVDRKTAVDILADGSFDVSQMVKAAMEPFVKQLVISKHFVERRENCRLVRLFAPPGDCIARDWTNEIRRGVGVDVATWNPLEKLNCAPETVTDGIRRQSVALAALIGACQGILTEQ